MAIHYEGRTHTGRRENNEDALLLRPRRGLFAVADGMGGYDGGEVASETALETIASRADAGDLGLAEGEQVARERLGVAIGAAHREVARHAVGPLQRMGTTLACLLLEGERGLVAHVGDSRVYRLREGELEGLTVDHSLHAMMSAAGVVGLPSRREFRHGNVITQALGQGRTPTPDLRPLEVFAGDRYLLCTDGISDVIEEEALAWLMSRSRGAAGAIIEAAYDAGSADNLTAVVVSVG